MQKNLGGLYYATTYLARANSIFWTRALNIPLPHSYVFPQIQGTNDDSSSADQISDVYTANISSGVSVNGMDEKSKAIFLLH